MLISIGEAAKQFNINRARIYRAIANGSITPKIDDSGVKLVDSTDVARVFGNKTANMFKPRIAVQDEKYIELLEQQLKQAQEREIFLLKQLDSKDFQINNLQKMIFLNAPSEEQAVQFEHEKEMVHSTKQTEGEPQHKTENKVKRSFLSRFFG